MNRYILNRLRDYSCYIFYKNELGLIRKMKVLYKYNDENSCFLEGNDELLKINTKLYSKLKLVALTPEGIYSTKVVLLHTNATLSETLYEFSVPKEWLLTQRRIGERIHLQVPFKLTFDDGFCVESTTFNISPKGISFNSAKRISTIYQKLIGILSYSLELRDGTKLNIKTNSKFVRAKANEDGSYLYVYTLLDLNGTKLQKLTDFFASYDRRRNA